MSRLKFRRKQKKYTEIYNTIIFKNKNVELTGLYTTIQACIDLEINTAGTDKEFIITKNGIRNFTGYGEKKFDRIWLELKEAGYLKQYKYRNLEVSGKWLYEYELLDEPDLTTYHSLLIQDDGTIVPNIPDNKLEKIKKQQEEKTLELSHEKVASQNRRVESSPLFLRGCEKGGFNNTFLNNVCKYLCIAKENFALSTEDKNYIETIKEKLSLDLFEQIVVDAKNKNKTFGYVIGTINKSLENNINTLEAFLENRKNYKTSNKKVSSSNNNSNNGAPKVKTRFHNINERFNEYAPDELENLLRESQKDKFGSNDPFHEMYLRAVNNGLDSLISDASRRIVLEYAEKNGLEIPK